MTAQDQVAAGFSNSDDSVESGRRSSATPSVARRVMAYLDRDIDTKAAHTLSVYACFLTGFTCAHSFTVRACALPDKAGLISGLLHLVWFSDARHFSADPGAIY